MGYCLYFVKVIPIDRNTDVRIKCFKCGGSYSMDQMRMDPNGKNLSCRNCLERKAPQKSPSEIGIAGQSSQAGSSPSLQKSTEKVQYFCKACKYSFTRAAHIRIDSCPYCSNAGGIVRKGSATSLVKEIEDMEGDEE